MQLLQIDSSILGDYSISRKLTAAIVARLRAIEPSLAVTYRDVGAAAPAHLTLANLPSEAADATPEAAASQAVLSEFLAADVVVIGAPMYNFTVPSQLKAWIDRILVAGKTFSYGANGPQGLMGGKRVIIALSRGGFYGAETPAATFEHLETYLRAVFGFIGISPEFVAADGVKVSPEQMQQSLDSANQAIGALKAA